MTMTMKIDADKKEEKERTSTAQPKKTSEKANEPEMPEEKIERLCRKEKWTAKDAGHFLFYYLEGYYGYPTRKQRESATDAQWRVFYSHRDKLMASKRSAATMEEYTDLYRFYLLMHELFNVQKEAFLRGVNATFYLVSYPYDNERGECTIETWIPGLHNEVIPRFITDLFVERHTMV